MVSTIEPSPDAALRALAEVMRKYHLSIEWDCDESSDMFGIRGEHMDVTIGERPILTQNGSSIDAFDVEDAIGHKPTEG